MRYFKIQLNYSGETKFISIDETELELALYLFIRPEERAIFKEAPVRGKDIITITENWHKAMGINPEWKLDTDDFNEMEKRGIKKKYLGVIAEVKNKIHYLIESKQEHLIGKNVKVLAFKKPKMELREGKTKSVSEIMNN